MWRMHARNCLFTQRQLILGVGLWMTGLFSGPGVLGNSGLHQVRQKPLPAPPETWPLPFSSSTPEASPSHNGLLTVHFPVSAAFCLVPFDGLELPPNLSSAWVTITHPSGLHIISFVPRSPAAFCSPTGWGSPSLSSRGILSGHPAPNKQLIWLYGQEVMWYNR